MFTVDLLVCEMIIGFFKIIFLIPNNYPRSLVGWFDDNRVILGKVSKGFLFGIGKITMVKASRVKASSLKGVTLGVLFK